MKKWWLKCAAQLVFSHVFMGNRINHAFRKRRLNTHFPELALQGAVRHLEMLRLTGIKVCNEPVLEVGAGWKPIQGYIFRLANCQRVVLCDLHRNLNRELLAVTISQLRNNADIVAKLAKINESQVARVLPCVSDQTFETLLKESGFEYYAPFDIRKTNLPKASIGIVTSRSTLEHIPPLDLRQMFRELRRIMKPSGAMVHTIDSSDHWQHFDPSISPVNFLKYPDWWWRIIGENNLVYHNRLRSYEFIEMIRDAGFRVSLTDAYPEKRALDDVRQMNITKRYREISPEKLAVLTTHLVAQPIG